jgi:hypothetical protein
LSENVDDLLAEKSNQDPNLEMRCLCFLKVRLQLLHKIVAGTAKNENDKISAIRLMLVQYKALEMGALNDALNSIEKMIGK